MLVVVACAVSLTGSVGGHLSAAGFAGVAAAALVLAYLDPVVAEKEVKLAAQRHRGRHVGKEGRRFKHYIRLNLEIRIPKSEILFSSNLFRISDFVLRIYL
jgi:hypothetical protein